MHCSLSFCIGDRVSEDLGIGGDPGTHLTDTVEGPLELSFGGAKRYTQSFVCTGIGALTPRLFKGHLYERGPASPSFPFTPFPQWLLT